MSLRPESVELQPVTVRTQATPDINGSINKTSEHVRRTGGYTDLNTVVAHL